MIFQIDLYHSIPEGVPYSSIEFRKLNSFEDQSWEYFDPQHYGYINQTVMFAKLYEPTTILVVGNLGPPNIEARNFSVNLISAGNFILNWDTYGDIDSDYILGWNIHQRVVPDFGGIIFNPKRIIMSYYGMIYLPIHSELSYLYLRQSGKIYSQFLQGIVHHTQ